MNISSYGACKYKNTLPTAIAAVLYLFILAPTPIWPAEYQIGGQLKIEAFQKDASISARHYSFSVTSLDFHGKYPPNNGGVIY
jgi:hypothetical protein